MRLNRTLERVAVAMVGPLRVITTHRINTYSQTTGPQTPDPDWPSAAQSRDSIGPNDERIHVFEPEVAAVTEEEANRNDSDTPTASSSKDTWIKCSQCSFYGPFSSFPLRMNGTGHIRTCSRHPRSTKRQGRGSLRGPSVTPSTPDMLSWGALLEEVRTQASGQIEFDRFVSVPSDHLGAAGDTLLIRANAIMDAVKHTSGYRFK